MAKSYEDRRGETLTDRPYKLSGVHFLFSLWLVSCAVCQITNLFLLQNCAVSKNYINLCIKFDLKELIPAKSRV